MRILGLVVASIALASTASAGVKLKAIRFPTSLGGNSGTKSPPTSAPLGQTVVFEFTGKPKIGPNVAGALQIRVTDTNPLGLDGRPAFGTYEAQGSKVIFTPRLPTAPLPDDFGPFSDNETDASLPGLLPGQSYEINVVVGVNGGVKNLDGVKNKVSLPLVFSTQPAVDGTQDAALYFANASDKAPKLKKNKTTPKPGTKGLYPNPFTDPAGIFSSIPDKKRPPFRLVFDSPLDPAAANFGPGVFSLHTLSQPQDVPLAVDVALTTNTADQSVVLLYPIGILPLGADIAVFLSDDLRGLGGASAGDPTLMPVADYRVALDPSPGTPIDDALLEDFEDTQLQDMTIAAEGLSPAAWDIDDSNSLRASFGFGGDGELGRFLAPDQPIVIDLDTDFQMFPLLSGSTPDVTPTQVTGGVFRFTDFHLPPQATLRIRGSNPAVIACTGDVLIEGLIDLNGQDGTADITFDSAIAPIPGGSAGPGGGRGGDSHPVDMPAGALFTMQTPQFGQAGFGPGNMPGGGAGGGQNGCTLPWIGFAAVSTCFNFGSNGDGSRASGGGGGSFQSFFPANDGAQDPTMPISGRRGGVGVGNHLPVVFDPLEFPITIPPEPDAYDAQPGNPTNAIARINTNPTFAEAHQFGLIWDTGFAMDVKSSFWAQTHNILLPGAAGELPFADGDPTNDFIGAGGELTAVQGGQGGGGGGSRTEGLTLKCKDLLYTIGFPLTVVDSRGGGGGGGGGALLLQARGIITFAGAAAKIEARGGGGAGGEQTGSSNRGGSGGGGSGGCVMLQSSTDIVMNDPALPKVVIDVSGGCGHDATQLSPSTATGVAGADSGVIQVGDGSPGGPGLVQIQVPDDSNIDKSRVSADIFPSAFNITCLGALSGVASFDPLVPADVVPALETSTSHARSVWIDTGAVTIDFRPPVITSAGALDGPIFGVPGVGPFFRGTDPNTGEVSTDSGGFVIDPTNNDIEVDSPDLSMNDFIPKSGMFFQTVRVLFQGADEDPANPGTPDLKTATPFVADATTLNGRRFFRWQVTFDIATDPGFPAGPTTPRPRVNFLRLPFQY